MPSGEEMYLWWSGEAESMFVYYLTGAIIIAFIATLAITRSLRRSEPIVTELLHEDNTREILVAYMLKLVTSVCPGSGCPESAKVFMQLTGENKLSQYFQLRSNTGGKAMLQRGFTDIFLFKVPESVGEIKSVEVFVAGLDVPLKWKLEEVELYCPSRRVRLNLPVTVTLLELLDLDLSDHILVASSSFQRWEKIQLLFHQWLAGYGNSVRVGAFTEIVHAMSVFVSLFTLLVLSQICYICLPRGDYVVPTEPPLTVLFTEYSDEEEDNSGPFDINISSLLVGAAIASAGCSLLTLCVEILLRSVKSVEKDPGKAYQKLCERDKNASQAKIKSIPSQVQFKRYFVQPLFLNSCIMETEKLQNIPDTDHKFEAAAYLKHLINYLQGEHEKYMKKVEAIRKKKEEEALKRKMQLKREQALKLYKEKKAKEKQDLKEKKAKEKQYLKEKKAIEKQKLKEKEAEERQRKTEDVSKVKVTSIESESIDELAENSEVENEIKVPTLSDISLSEFVASETSTAPKSAGSYLDMLKMKRQTNSAQTFFREPGSFQQYEMSLESDLKKILFDDDDDDDDDVVNDDDDDDDDNEYLEAKGPSFIDAKGRSFDSFVSAEFDSSQNAKEDKFDNIQAEVDPGKSYECLIDIPESDHTSAWQQNKDDAEESISCENFCRTEDWIKFSERSKAAQKGFVQAWQANQKAWCRKVIKELCDIIRSTREMLIADELSFFQMQSRMLDSSHSILQLLLVACSVHCNEEQFKILMSKEMLSLMWHLSMEIVVNVLHEIFHVLQLHDSAVLADLVLQSHHVMLIVQHAVYPVLFMLQYASDQLCILRYIPLEKDLHCMVVELAKCCFELVVKYNLALWQKIKIIVDRELKETLDEGCFMQLLEFVQSNIQEHSTEQTVVKRLCNFVEDSCREETWEELHDEHKFYSNILVKVQLLKLLRRKITNLTRKKVKFDKVNDLLPKEPKSRLQLLVEKRKKLTDSSSHGDIKQSESSRKHVHWSKELLKVEPVTVKKEELEKQSKELGQFIENLSIMYNKLKKMLERQGINQSIKGSVLLAQAVLHPHVIVTLGEVSIQGKYQFDNFLHLKRTENFLAQYYEVTVKDLVAYLLNTVVKEHNVQYGLHVQFDTLVNEVLVKVDTLAEILSEDVETIMHRCIKMEPCVVNGAQGIPSIQVESVVKPSVNSLLRTPSIQKWSGLDLKDCTPSEMSELGKMLPSEDLDMTKLLKFYKNNSAGDKGNIWSNENNSNTGILDTDDIQLEVETKNWSLTDIIEDLRPLKGYLEYLKHGELLRNMVTQMGHIERSKHKREYFNTVQINNIIDSYYMLDEGDDSQTLTKAGLYQLEHDCTGEDQKSLPPWVKTLTVTLMLIALVLIVVYITVIGGQFSTTELQEWMCYFLLAVAMFGLVLEQFRAYAVSVYIQRWKHAVAQKSNR